MKGGSHVVDVSFNYEKNRHKIVCLIGSTKFKNTFLEMIKYYMSLGYIVLSKLFYEDTNSFSQEDKNDLIPMYKKYIDLADVIIVINVDNYIDNDTLDLIDYTIHCKEKNICYLSKMLEKQQIKLSSIKAEKKDKK